MKKQHYDALIFFFLFSAPNDNTMIIRYCYPSFAPTIIPVPPQNNEAGALCLYTHHHRHLMHPPYQFRLCAFLALTTAMCSYSSGSG